MPKTPTERQQNCREKFRKAGHVVMTIRVNPATAARLRGLAKQHGTTQARIIEMGTLLAQAHAAAKEKPAKPVVFIQTPTERPQEPIQADTAPELLSAPELEPAPVVDGSDARIRAAAGLGA